MVYYPKVGISTTTYPKFMFKIFNKSQLLRTLPQSNNKSRYIAVTAFIVYSVFSFKISARLMF